MCYFPLIYGEVNYVLTLVIGFSQKRKRSTHASLYSDEEVKSSVMERAKDVQANLAPQFPSFIKPMLPSHVSGGFWLVNLF